MKYSSPIESIAGKYRQTTIAAAPLARQIDEIWSLRSMRDRSCSTLKMRRLPPMQTLEVQHDDDDAAACGDGARMKEREKGRKCTWRSAHDRTWVRLRPQSVLVVASWSRAALAFALGCRWACRERASLKKPKVNTRSALTAKKWRSLEVCTNQDTGIFRQRPDENTILQLVIAWISGYGMKKQVHNLW